MLFVIFNKTGFGGEKRQKQKKSLCFTVFYVFQPFNMKNNKT